MTLEKQAPSVGDLALSYGHKAVAVGSFFTADAFLKAKFFEYGITFPSALGGMFLILGTLLALEPVAPKVVDGVFVVFRPGLDWIARWMPLFYVPSLIVLPLALQGMEGATLGKLLGITSVGFVASLVATAGLAVGIRSIFGGAADEAKPSTGATAADQSGGGNVFTDPPPPAAKEQVLLGWGAVWGVSLLAAFMQVAPISVMGLPFMLASVISAFLIGTSFPDDLKKVVHPLITCFVLSDVAAVLLGYAYGVDWTVALGAFLTRGAGPMGAGDLLMKFLGCVILSFGFRVYEQRALIKRNFVEIFGTMTLSSLFSLVVTLAVGRLLGLDSELTRAVAPRCVTVALALPVAAQLGAAAQAPITAVTVVFTGLLGANFAQALLTKFGFKDPITRGLATAGSSHGLGTAALAATEQEALPFAALAYASMGIITNVLVSVPVISTALIAIAG